MAGRVGTNQKTKPLVFERDTSCALSPKSTLNLMQNCDLPPPIKLFSGHEGMLLSSISKKYGIGDVEVKHEHICVHNDCLEDGKLEILKALRLSQTRAREAERKLRVVSEEKDELSKLIIEESMRVYAHRLRINLMELEVLKLQIQQKENYYSTCNCAEKSGEMEDCDESNSSKNWCTALVFCFAIAFGCTYLF